LPSQTSGGSARSRAVTEAGWATAWARTAAVARAAAVKPPRYSQPAGPSAWDQSQAVPSTPATASGAVTNRSVNFGTATASAQPISSACARVSVPKYARLTSSGR
jgi:hypothetical protein